jgi:hypothetical protein
MPPQSSTLVVAVVAIGLAAVAGGCGTKTKANQASPPNQDSPPAASLSPKVPNEGASFRSNQRHLSRAQSLRLVAWASTFRTCMVEEGVELGPLVKDEKQIAMKLPAGANVHALPRLMVVCGEEQGGPPRRASLQYQPGEVVLYLPKQCLLDKRVATSS